MEIRHTRTDEERLEAERVIRTAFLLGPESEHETDDASEMWAAFEGGRMLGAVSVQARTLTLDGSEVPAGELHMVGTLPEARGMGVARNLIESILADFRSRGYPLATLIPFSEAFYRAFGFECAAANLEQEVAVEELRTFEPTLVATQLKGAEGLDEMRELYWRFARRLNLADLRDDASEWAPQRFGEYGRRAFGFEDKTHYTYLLRDATGALRAYLTFVYVEDDTGPFTGTMQVTDIAFEDGEALRATLAFAYGMRAKVRRLRLTLPASVDLALLVPEGAHVKRTLDSHTMFRVLDVKALLERRRWDVSPGTFCLRVQDPLIQENSGIWRVEVEGGRAKARRLAHDTQATADLDLSTQALCLLVCSCIGLDEALLRADVTLRGNRELLGRHLMRRACFSN